VTFPLFLRTVGGDADIGAVSRFHARLTRDAGIESRDPAPVRAAIGGVAVPELLFRLRNGDRDALTTLYAGLFESLWRVAELQTRSAEVAKDVVHDVFLWLWMHRTSIASDIDVRVYLTAAVRNRARDLAKHARVVESHEHRSPTPDVAGVARQTTPTDAVAESEEFLTAYHDALSLLSERELTAAMLRWEEGLTLEQIAQVLGVSTRGAGGIIARAQAKVADALRRFR